MVIHSHAQLTEVTLESLVLSPTNPRKQFDPQQHAELTASIREKGILVPLLCRPLAPEQLEVVAGARRYHAAKAAGLAMVPALVRAMTDTEALEVQLIENLQRADVHPLDEGEAYHTLRTTAGYDLATIVAKVGKSRRYVTQRLQLTTLSVEAQAAFRDDRISVSHAFLIARLPPDEQASALGACYRRRWSVDGETKQLVSVEEFAEWIANTLHLNLRRAPFNTTDTDLLPDAGACTTCSKRTGSAPDLFPDIAKPDTCTDRACFARKLDAYLTQRKQTLTTEGVVPLELSTVHGFTQQSSETAPLPQSRWVEAEPESCAYTSHGLVVHGHRVGMALTVCAAPQCSTHRWVRPGSNQSERDAHREQQREQRVEHTVRTSVIKDILSHVVAPLPRPVANHFVITCFEHLWHEYQKQIVAFAGWGNGGQQNVTSVVTAQIPNCSDTELAQFMVTMLLIRELYPTESHRTKSALLEAIAAHYGVDISAIRKQVTSTLEAKKATTTAARSPRQPRRTRATAETP